VFSLCFCSRLTNSAAEAGLRTEADHRRRGYGAAVTAAWAYQVVATGMVAFYSTSSDNLASQAVAARLGLRPIGWRWQLSSTRG
jgi:predicted GNAT family acetyltransferase